MEFSYKAWVTLKHFISVCLHSAHIILLIVIILILDNTVCITA